MIARAAALLLLFASSACVVAQSPPEVKEIQAEQVAAGFAFTEGPTLGRDGAIYFSDMPKRKVHRFDPATSEVTVFVEDSGGSNGLHWDHEGRLLLCADRDRKVLRRESDGTMTLLLDAYDGKKLNSPNDLDLDPQGGIYFSDPRFGKPDGRELDVEGVYYLPPNGSEAKQLLTNLEKPNGVAVSPDGKTLYVADNGAGQVMAYDIAQPGELANPRLFADPEGKGSPDGMTTDSRGNVYAAWYGANAVYVWNPAGEHIAKIAFGPDQPTNVELTADEKTLYITGGKVLQRADVSSLK